MTTAYQYDGDAVLLEQQGGATTASYAYGNALTRKDGETPLFDGQGSERTVTNTGGSVQASLTLTAFGQAVASSGSSTDPYQYAATSRYRSDGDAGLALVGCRYYDAQVGQFITRDTYLDQKPYAYCDGDPVNATDPSGHFELPWWVKTPIAITGAALLAGGAIAFMIYEVTEVNEVGNKAKTGINRIINRPDTMDHGIDRKTGALPTWSDDPYGKGN